MWFLNQVPAQLPPLGIGRATPPRWAPAGTGDALDWHDGRLHALASTALPQGPGDLGTWRIPLLVDGHPAAITGELLYAPSPSIVWFWPILVALACVAAALRLRRAHVEERVARGLAVGALAAFVLAAVGQQLHGRPTVSVGQMITLAVAVAFAGWAAQRLARHRHGWFIFFLIAAAAIWEGATLIAVLLDGFVLIALPAAVARAAVIVCLTAGVGLLPIVFALAERPSGDRRSGSQRPDEPAAAPPPDAALARGDVWSGA
jgi:hypothetical protein